MPSMVAANGLASQRQVTLVLRLVLDRQGQLLRGEVIDLEARSLGRFSTWRDLARTVRAAIVSQLEEGGTE